MLQNLAMGSTAVGHTLHEKYTRIVCEDILTTTAY